MISMITNHFYLPRSYRLLAAPFFQCAVFLLTLCVPVWAVAAEGVSKQDFGTEEGQPNTLYTLTNKDGMSVSIMNYGATVVKLMAPDKNGKMDDVVLGFDDLTGYLDPKKDPHFGATIGRYGNRIAKGQFTLDGQSYQLPINDPPNSLHGGPKGFDHVMWNAEIVSKSPPAIVFTRVSPDGEEGYPGTMKASVRYTLTEDNQMKLYFTAKTDKPTVVNLTHHSYFNLGGAGSGTILDERVTINADAYTPVDSTLIPTGEIKSVEGTPMDFRQPTAIGDRIQQVGGKPIGYDHNYVLRDAGSGVREIVKVEDPKTGRVMKVYSDQPGVQFYTGNFLDGSITGKNGAVYQQYDALCLEPQHFPDSPNEPKFPSTVLKPGQTYHCTINYGFSVAK
jgi:aldose 1-epimerase